MKILNLGSLNIDKVYQVNHFVKGQETISAEECHVYPGGKGLNQSVAIARAGGEVFHAGAVGSDGGNLLSVLKKENVNLELVRRTEGVSGSAIIQVAGGENAIIVFGGANKEITREDVDRALERFGKEDYLLLQNETSFVSYAIRRAREKGMTVAFNASPVTEAMRGYPLEMVDIFFVNEIEAKYLAECDEGDYQMILERLHQKYPAATLVMTVGEEGVYYQSSHEFLHLPANQVPVADTTAAGDTFGGYYLACISKSMTVKAALEAATTASGLAVGRNGASSSIPYWEEVESMLKKGRMM